MRILVIGRSGQVASALAACAAGKPAVEIMALGRPDFDLLRDDVAPVLAEARPDIVINAAAYTAVDAAEGDAPAAFALNAEAPARLADAASRAGVPLFHISTDYVFDGTDESPRREDDATAPLSLYGQSKLAGERAVLASAARAYVFRTAWVHGARGNNFVRTIIRLARNQPRLRVVNDQWGNPTAASAMAQALLAAAHRVVKPDAPAPGLYHLTGQGVTTWHGFASAIVHEAASRGLAPAVPVEPITTAEFPRPAPRPRYAAMDCGKLFAAFGIALPPWQESLHAVIQTIAAEEGGR